MTKIFTTPVGKQFISILAKGAVLYMREHGIEVSPNGFKHLVEVSKESGLNAGLLLEKVQDELAELHSSATSDEVREIGEAFIEGSCQRGLAWKAILEMRENNLN